MRYKGVRECLQLDSKTGEQIGSAAEIVVGREYRGQTLGLNP